MKFDVFVDLVLTIVMIIGGYHRNVPSAALAGVAFVVMIALSCVFTKQHYLMDIPVALGLGWVSFWIFLRVV